MKILEERRIDARGLAAGPLAMKRLVLIVEED